jgi:hypothetical protein
MLLQKYLYTVIKVTISWGKIINYTIINVYVLSIFIWMLSYHYTLFIQMNLKYINETRGRFRGVVINLS